MPAPRLDRTLLPAVFLLIGLMVFFELTRFDLWLQDRSYDFRAGRWLVDGRDPWLRAVFYTGPKIALYIFGCALLGLILGPARWRDRLGLPGSGGRRDLLVVFATLASVPLLAGLGKTATNVFCPSEIRRYGGDVPYVTLCSRFPPADRPVRRGHCFPAGHASGGFALVSLAGLARSRRGAALGLLAGLVAGGAMGVYQMLKGAHYLSHTVFTMVLAWGVFLVWRRILLSPAPRAAGVA